MCELSILVISSLIIVIYLIPIKSELSKKDIKRLKDIESSINPSINYETDKEFLLRLLYHYKNRNKHVNDGRR
jgi:hypothetical protein